MQTPRLERLLAFARGLQTASSFPELLEVALVEVREALGYSHVWLLVPERDDLEELRLLAAGERQEWRDAPILRVRGDAFLEEVVRATGPVVVVDAQTDPRTDKAIAARWNNRTLIQIPLRLVDRPLGVIGVGTFGDEGPRPPSPEQLEYLIGMASQLTVAAARIRLAEERHAKEQVLRTLTRAVEQSPVSIIVTDRHGAIEYVNPKFTDLTGYAQDEVRGRNPRFLKSGEMPPETYRELWQTIAAGRAWHGQLLNRKKDGTLYWESATIAPVLDGAGAITHYVAVKEDITERVRLEEQVRHSQKIEAVGQLAGGLAHDFNNILAAMSVGAEFLGPADGSPEAREAMEDLRAALDRGTALTRQLLAFSRRSVMQPRPLDLNEQIGNLVKMLRRLVPEDVILDLALCPGPLVVHADPGMLDQVLVNLVVNARDAMPRGGTLGIRTFGVTEGSGDAARRCACLQVTDTGVGMVPEVQRHLFEPFFTTKAPGKGTGLGLATVASIVDRHGGTVTVQSEVGRGATFEVCLPVVASPAARAAAAPVRAPAGRGETILLVEDDPFVRQPIRRLLERNGYRVLEAATGREALDAWEARRGDVQLLLTDIVLPGGITGRELAARLVQRGPRLRVVFTSGYAADGAASELAPVDVFVPKPCPPDQLLAVLRRALDG